MISITNRPNKTLSYY